MKWLLKKWKKEIHKTPEYQQNVTNNRKIVWHANNTKKYNKFVVRKNGIIKGPPNKSTCETLPENLFVRSIKVQEECIKKPVFHFFLSFCPDANELFAIFHHFLFMSEQIKVFELTHKGKLIVWGAMGQINGKC